MAEGTPCLGSARSPRQCGSSELAPMQLVFSCYRRPMVVKQAAALALFLSTLGGALCACTPAPSKAEAGGEGEEARAEASPETLCQHVREIAAKDTDDAAVLDQVQRECVQSLTTMQSRYQTFSTCVELAGNAQAILQCEEALKQPPSLLAAGSPTAKLEALCDHVITMLKSELGDMAGQMGPEQLAQLRQRCITDAGKQIEAKGIEAFNREADCILKAQNLQELEACGPRQAPAGQPGARPAPGAPPAGVQPAPGAPPAGVQPAPAAPPAEAPAEPAPAEPAPAEPAPAEAPAKAPAEAPAE